MTQVTEQPKIEQPNLEEMNPQDRFLAESALALESKKTPESTTTEAVVEEKKEENNPTVITDKPTSELDKPEPEVKDIKIETTTSGVENDDFDEAAVLEKLGFKEEKKEDKPDAPLVNNEEFELYKSKATELENLLNDSEVQFILEARKKGQSLVAAVKEIQGEDYSKLSAKELFELDLNTQGLDDDAKAIEMEKFNGMLVFQQKELGNKIKQNLDAKQGAKLEQYNRAQVESQAVIKANAQKAMQRVNELKEQKSYMNLEITPERWEKIYDHVDKNIKPDSNLEFNVDEAYEYAIFKLFRKDLIMANVRKAKTAARVEVITDMTRPSIGSSNSQTKSPVTDGVNDMKKESDEFFRQRAESYS